MHNLQTVLQCMTDSDDGYRQAALAQAMIQGWPTRRDEAWRYTDTHALQSVEWRLARQGLALDITALLFADCDYLVMINGEYQANLSSVPEEVKLEWSIQSVADIPENSSVFYHLNAAFINRALTVVVPENTRLQRPLQLLSVFTHEDTESMLHQQCRIHLESGAEAVICEDFYGNTDVLSWRNTITEIVADEQAILTYTKCQRESAKTWHLAHTHITQARSATVNYHHVALGGAVNRESLAVRLVGCGAQCHLKGFYQAGKNQHIAHHMTVDHQAKHCETHQHYRGMASDGGQGVFDSKIIVHPEGGGAVAHQSNPNLLLTSDAEIDTKPGLEIYTDDVQCSHGATVGQLDEQAVFYMQSRGISIDEATQLLKQAFMSELLDEFADNAVNAAVKRLMEEKHHV